MSRQSLVGGSAIILTKHATSNKLASATIQLTTTHLYSNKVLQLTDQATPNTCFYTLRSLFTAQTMCMLDIPSVSVMGIDCIENNMFGFQF